MPLPSVGLSHLRVRSQRKHTFEERLAALTVADEVERLELAAQWRNSNRPSTSGGTVGGRSGVVGEDDHPPAAPAGASRSRSATHTATAAQQELMIVSTSAQRRIRPATTTTTTSEVQGERRKHPPPPEQQQQQHAFLSPPSTRVRGPLSYVEDPRVLKRAQNPYYVYFASDVHDMEIAQQLAATSPSLKKKQKGGGGGGGGGPLPFETMLVPNASSSPYHDLPTVASVSGSISQSRGVSFGASGDYKSSHRYDEDDVPVIMVQSQRASIAAAGPAGGGRNGGDAYLSMSSVHTAASASHHGGGSGGPGRRSREVTIAPQRQNNSNNDDWDDDDDQIDDEEDFLDDLGFAPSLPLGLLSMAHQKSQQKQQLQTSFLSVHPPNANVHLPTFGGGSSTGSSRHGSLSVDRSQRHHGSNSNSAIKKKRSGSSSRSQKNSSAAKLGGSLHFGKGKDDDDEDEEDDEEDHHAGYDDEDEDDGPRLPDHHIDRARLKQFKSRYAAPPVDVAQLKPKCAILHVKLEKLNQRMKAEDDEFTAYRDAYLKKVRR